MCIIIFFLRFVFLKIKINEWNAYTHSCTHATLHHFERVVVFFILESEEEGESKIKTSKCRYKIRNIIIILLKCVLCVCKRANVCSLLMFMFLSYQTQGSIVRTYTFSFANIVRFVLLILSGSNVI